MDSLIEEFLKSNKHPSALFKGSEDFIEEKDVSFRNRDKSPIKSARAYENMNLVTVTEMYTKENDEEKKEMPEDIDFINMKKRMKRNSIRDDLKIEAVQYEENSVEEPITFPKRNPTSSKRSL